jgi:hypothetical protein
LIILLAACAAPQATTTPPRGPASPAADPGAPNPYQPQPSDSALQRGAAMLDSAQIVARESFPPQYSLLLKGNLPTPCHQLRIALGAPDANKIIQAQLYSVVDPNRMCIQVLAPFEAAIRLEGYAAGKYSVQVNGAPAGEIEIPAR